MTARSEDASRRESGDRKLTAAKVSVGVNVSLIVLKLVTGLVTGSLGVLALAADSVVDLVASLFAYWGIRLSNQPPDREHHYGHEKFENLSSLIQILLMGVVCLSIFAEALRRIFTGFTISVTSLAVGIMLVAMATDFVVSRYLARVAREEGSAALEADAYHFSTDLWSSAAVIFGLIAAGLGYEVLDPIAAILVAGLIMATVLRLGHRSTRVLLDASPGEEMERDVRRIIQSHAAVANFHSLRLRQAGNSIFMDFCLEVAHDMSLAQAHEVSHELSQKIREELPQVREVMVHIEPAGIPHAELDKEHA
jgi:cation diffusion facilitator family transporter